MAATRVEISDSQKKSKSLFTYGLEVVSVEPGGQTRHLLAELDSVGGTVVSLVVRGRDDGDEGEAHGHEESGELSEVHDDVL